MPASECLRSSDAFVVSLDFSLPLGPPHPSAALFRPQTPSWFTGVQRAQTACSMGDTGAPADSRPFPR